MASPLFLSSFDNNTCRYLLWQIICFFQASLAHTTLYGHIILHLSFTRELLPTFCVVMCSYHIVHGLLLVFVRPPPLPLVFLQSSFVKGLTWPYLQGTHHNTTQHRYYPMCTTYARVDFNVGTRQPIDKRRTYIRRAGVC
jgi:hypothetical protein